MCVPEEILYLSPHTCSNIAPRCPTAALNFSLNGWSCVLTDCGVMHARAWQALETHRKSRRETPAKRMATRCSVPRCRGVCTLPVRNQRRSPDMWRARSWLVAHVIERGNKRGDRERGGTERQRVLESQWGGGGSSTSITITAAISTATTYASPSHNLRLGWQPPIVTN